ERVAAAVAPGVSAPPSTRVLVAALRPKQWAKNLLLFSGLVFALKLGHLPLVLSAVLAFCAFCALSSAGYLVNDVLDAAADRRHPVKRLRPVASGALPAWLALVLAAALALVGALLAAWIGVTFLVVAGLYLAITLGYSLGLKH